MYFQDVILKLINFWKKKGCLVFQPYNSEVGAGTFNPATFLRCLGPFPWRCVYVEPSKRPKDARYAQNPNRVCQYYQLQVILKPPPENIQEIYLDSLKTLGIKIDSHDIRFVEDNWESPTLGAWGVGWEVWLDGQEITQFTYFQQMGGFDLNPITCEITYGLERITMYLQKKDSIFEIEWVKGIKWGDIYKENEEEFSKFYYEIADINFYLDEFSKIQKETEILIEKKLLYPAYHNVIKLSHIFNILDARGAFSPKERNLRILKIREYAKKCAEIYLERIGVLKNEEISP